MATLTLKDLPTFLQDKIYVNPQTECWEWTGYLNKLGYGRYASKGAYKLVYEILREKVEKGFVLDHLCRIRCCVNPHHLEVVTQKINCLRGESPSGINAAKTHCKNGHELSGDNVRIIMRKRNWGIAPMRQCRACEKEAQNKCRERKKTK